MPFRAKKTNQVFSMQTTLTYVQEL